MRKKDCTPEQWAVQAAYRREYRNKPENKAREAARRQALDRANPERVAARRKYLSDYARLRNTGFTAEQYATAMERQGGACAICQSTLRLHADHDHVTGAPRGILCAPCNQAEGKIRWSGLTVEEFARRLSDYLANPPLSRSD